MLFNPADHPHRRKNLLTGKWVLVSPHRAKRPWQGRVEKLADEEKPQHDSKCYLCPGNKRVSGALNPVYTGTFVFPNDHEALLADTPLEFTQSVELLELEPIRGTCRVMCFSPRHDLSLAQMDLASLRMVVDTWASQLEDLSQTYTWVQIFESKGQLVGASNPHPHGQIWASNFLPNEALAEDREQRAYFERKDTPLLVDYARLELAQGERIVVENEHWLVVVPYWAYWPFETLVLPRRHVLRLTDLSNSERGSLAEILKRMLTRFDNLFETAFPYCSGWHNAPSGEGFEHWQLHAHYYPPLLRSATIQKFVASYEWLAEAQRDLSPEQAAERLREVSDKHYKSG
ncbi:MAG: UDP-glucose--hexose-1-phosphate uridylyltransferase [Trueperaceae bacterium]|nr:UDP-glucose--hexose-1-phosphate uridylyltransferase [Trueperaceae bacterium]